MKLEMIEKWIVKVVNIITGIVTSLVVLLVLSQVIFRYVLKLSVPWTEEIARTMYIWIVYVAIILVEREDGHIRTTLLIDKLSPKVRVVWETIICITCILFNLCVFIGSIIGVGNMTTFLSSLTWIPQKIMYYPILFASPFMIMYEVVNLIKRYRGLSKGKTEVKA